MEAEGPQSADHYGASAVVSDEPLSVSFDDEGDLRLVVECIYGSRRKVLHARVSTKVLKLASPVFATMFRPGFQEGNSLQSQPQSGSGSRATDTFDLPVIHLYEDNTWAMEVLLNALHFRCDRIPSKLEIPVLS
jgi:hypothetical protein